jgi:hypothetical protein
MGTIAINPNPKELNDDIHPEREFSPLPIISAMLPKLLVNIESPIIA